MHGTALPLNLISFTATRAAGSNLLQWSTTSEINTDHFEVQSSRDAKNFVKITTVEAAGSGDFQYRYNDLTDYGGTIYYRLKMSDIDGTFTHSKIVPLQGDETITANKQQINIKTLASGLYILKFADGTGERFVKD